MSVVLHGRKSAIASTTALSLAAGSLVAMAVVSRGQAATNVTLNDASVWVTGTSGDVLGLFNAEIKQSVIGLIPHSERFDVVQDGSTVFLNDTGGSRLRAVDVAGAAFAGVGAEVPKEAQVSMGGGVVTVLSPSGGLWIRSATDAATANYGVAPDAELGSAAAVAVGRDGTVHAASVSNSRLLTIPRGTQAAAAKTTSLPAGTRTVAVTAVGATPVLLLDGNTVLLPGGERVELPGGATEARLQQVGVAAGAVVVASRDALFSIGLEDRKVTTLAEGLGTGDPAEPVRLGRCSYAAWGNKPTLVTACDGSEETVAPVGGAARAKLVFRVNRGRIVLNDVDSGNTFLVNDPGQQLADWKSARVREDGADQDPNKTDSSDNSDIKPEDRNGPNRPPTAVPDTFGVRDGGTVVLPILANDGDRDGDVLTVAELKVASDRVGTVQIVENGKAVQFSALPGATGTALFDYVVSDGRGGTATAQVSVPVVPIQSNSPPRPLSATATSSTAVVRGGRVVHNVLKDWIDPDGDALLLDCPAPSPDVVCSPDGQVAYQARRQTGVKDLSFEVTDGREQSKSNLTISVIAPGAQPPVARSDFVHAFVGRTTVVHPLSNDTAFGKKPATLGKVDGPIDALAVLPDPDTGAVSITATSAGTFYLTYQIAADEQSAFGIVRIDVSAPSGDSQPIAAPDSALVEADEPALVDVLANDVDPGGNVLLVTDLRSSSPHLTLEVLNHRLVRVSAASEFTGPASVDYTVHAGTKAVSSFILVRRNTEGTPNQAPVAKDDRIVARVGQPVYIGVLGNDVDPEAGQLSVEPELIGRDSAFRPAGRAASEISKPVEAFVSDDEVRLLAPTEPGLVSLSYSVVDPEGTTSTASVSVQVIAHDAPNRAPTPKQVEARVLAGRSVTIDIPLPGIDPDGDPVKLEPVDSPAKGTLAMTKDNRLVYTAGPEEGTYEFHYSVTDAGGLAGQSTVLVGVAPLSLARRPPVAINDEAQIRNDRDRVISIPVLANDSDPDGDALALQPTLEKPVGVKAQATGEYVAVTVPRGSTDQLTMGYSISSPGGTDEALVSVTPSATAPLIPPTAVDDFPVATGTAPTIDVPVLTNDRNAMGPATELVVSPRPGAVGPPGVAARLDAKTVRVTRTERDQWATYTVHDADGGESKAFIFVPRNDNQAPRPVDPLPAFEVKAGTTKKLSIADFAVDPEGAPIELTTPEAISASGVAINEVGRTSFGVTPTIPSGQASVTFEVMDGTDRADARVRKSTITIVVEVLPIDEVPPVFATQRLVVEHGETKAVTLDLDKHTTAGPNDAGRFTYDQLSGRIAGLSASLGGSRGRTLSVSARDAAVGTRATLTFRITLGKVTSTGRIDVEVLRSTRPPPRATDCSAGTPSAGSTVTVDLTRCTVNPFAADPLTVVPGTWRTSAGVAVARGLTVSISVPATFSGSARLPYTVRDKLGRTATAAITYSVLGKPGPPGQPSIVTPLPGGGAVLLTWGAADANGGTIDYYTVNDRSNGYSFRCKGASTRCLITGVDYSKSYTFTVTAHSVQQGDGQPSAPVSMSAMTMPPSAPTNVNATAGDRRATVTWTGGSTGSPIASYTVTVRPSPVSGSGSFTVAASAASQRASLTVDDLRNGTDYTFAVVANGRNGDSSAAAVSDAVTPAGPPNPPAAPSAVSSGGLRGGQVTVGWDPGNVLAAANGRIASLKVIQGGSESAVLEATAALASGRLVVDRLDASSTYTFALQVTNSAGLSATSASTSAAVEGKPGTPTWNIPTAGDGLATLQFSLGSPNGSAYRSISVLVTDVAGGAVRTVNVNPVAGQSSYSVVVGSLINGRTYRFSVTACNVSQCSDPATAPTTVTPFGRPTAPQPEVSINRRMVTFSWDEPTFNGSAGQLSIAVSGGSVPANACPATTTGAGTCTFRGAWNTEYTMTITATTNGGSDVKTVSGQVAPAIKPVAPPVTAATELQEVTFTWGAPQFGDIPGSMSLAVTGTGYPGGCPATTTEAGSCTFTGEWGTAYTLVATATSEGGVDRASAATRVMAAPVPVAPQPTATAAGPRVTFAWGRPDYNGLPGTMSIGVTGAVADAACPDAATRAGSCSFIGEWNTSYAITVGVATAGGTDAKSATVLVGPPPAPVAPQPSGSTNGRQVTFTWGAPDYNGLPGTMTIDVSGAGYPGGCPATDGGAGSCSFVGSFNSSYTMTITVATAGGGDQKSTTAEVGAAPAPVAPRPEASADGRQVTFSWGDPDYNGLSGRMSISVTGDGYPGGCPESAEGSGSCSFTGNYSTTYTMTITVESAGGSDTASRRVTTGDAPPPPTPDPTTPPPTTEPPPPTTEPPPPTTEPPLPTTEPPPATSDPPPADPPASG